MAQLAPMPQLIFEQQELQPFGVAWYHGAVINNILRPHRLAPGGDYSSSNLGKLCNRVVATAFAAMLGGVGVVQAKARNLMPAQQIDCVEYGEVRIIGGVRPQNFDVAYRPDGVRFAFDSKTLNDTDSVRKNYQNMVNDLATEATTVHTRFPYAVVAFIMMVPLPCMQQSSSIIRAGLIGSLERLAKRVTIDGPAHMAEAISLVIWNPDTGEIDATIPDPESQLRLESFHKQVEAAYTSRYKGLPPHAA